MRHVTVVASTTAKGGVCAFCVLSTPNAATAYNIYSRSHLWICCHLCQCEANKCSLAMQKQCEVVAAATATAAVVVEIHTRGVWCLLHSLVAAAITNQFKVIDCDCTLHHHHHHCRCHWHHHSPFYVCILGGIVVNIFPGFCPWRPVVAFYGVVLH